MPQEDRPPFSYCREDTFPPKEEIGSGPFKQLKLKLCCAVGDDSGESVFASRSSPRHHASSLVLFTVLRSGAACSSNVAPHSSCNAPSARGNHASPLGRQETNMISILTTHRVGKDW